MKVFVLFAAIAVVVTGCNATRKTVAPRPPKELYINAEASDKRLPDGKGSTPYFKDNYAHASDRDCVENVEPPEGTKTALRNQYIRVLLLKVDTEYFKFTNDLYVGRSAVGFSGDLATLGLSTAGAIAGDKDLKSALAATAAAVTGSSAAFDKRFFQDQAIGALLTTMNASRTTVLAYINNNLKLCSVKYTLDRALIDVATYHRAGTLLDAIAEIQKEQGEKAATASAEINKANLANSDAQAMPATAQVPKPTVPSGEAPPLKKPQTTPPPIQP